MGSHGVVHSDFDKDLDLLFRLPLAKFTAARNVLSRRLTREGRTGDARRVRRLDKPTLSAWALNQAYFEHTKEFETLSGIGRTHGAAGADALDRRRALRDTLLEAAGSVLEGAGHVVTHDLMRRMQTRLEALAVMAAEGETRPGRLTGDLDPPLTEALSMSGPAGRGRVREVAVRRSDEAHQTSRRAFERAREAAERAAHARERALSRRESARAESRSAERGARRAERDAEKAKQEMDRLGGNGRRGLRPPS